ncbi:hypothetical protein [Pseudomonas sp. PDM31]|uniref:hypothetical protein n=1 Tax=Pseudomonas sp. PDM31 TaxID=2854778 RepID=UPI001C44716F|nr:hypothetical protein [Pseudomonas sp. PDM31]MBV7480341.1 hypothetical protein [Pseudomonas sp. PDM31]
MKVDNKQQALNELCLLFAPLSQHITQPFQPLAKSIENVGNSLYVLQQDAFEVERTLDDLPLDDYLKLPELVKQQRELRQAGGRARGAQRKQEAKEQREKIIAKWHSLETTPERYRVGIIAGTEGYPSENTIRRTLRDVGLI